MMNCPFCHKEIVDDAQACRHCWKEIPKASTSEVQGNVSHDDAKEPVMDKSIGIVAGADNELTADANGAAPVKKKPTAKIIATERLVHWKELLMGECS